MEPRLHDVFSFFCHLIFKKIKIAIRAQQMRGRWGGQRGGREKLVGFVLLMCFVVLHTGSLGHSDRFRPPLKGGDDRGARQLKWRALVGTKGAPAKRRFNQL